MIIVSNHAKQGIEFIGGVGLAACSDLLQCGVSIHTHERDLRSDEAAAKRPLFVIWVRTEKRCVSAGGSWSPLCFCVTPLGECGAHFWVIAYWKRYCQRLEESGKSCCCARGIDLWEKIKVRVAHINVDWDWSRREKRNIVQILKQYLHQKRRRISHYCARSLVITKYNVKLGERKSFLFISTWLSETCSFCDMYHFLLPNSEEKIHGTFVALSMLFWSP